MSVILEYVSSYNIEPLLKVLKGVYQEKYDKLSVDCEVLMLRELSVSGIIKKNKLLSDKELYYLYEWVGDVVLYLDSVMDYDSEYRGLIEDFDSNDYPVDEIYRLEESLCDEIERRKPTPNKDGMKLKKNIGDSY